MKLRILVLLTALLLIVLPFASCVQQTPANEEQTTADGTEPTAEKQTVRI